MRTGEGWVCCRNQSVRHAKLPSEFLDQIRDRRDNGASLGIHAAQRRIVAKELPNAASRRKNRRERRMA